jgi:hypothetical protein
MGGSKSPEIPSAPTYQNNPALQSNIDWGTGIGKQLTSLDLTGQLSNLAPLIQNDPEVTKLALQYAEQSLTPAWRDTVTNIKNEAANSGALQSSTFTDALTKSGSDLQSQFQAITTQAALADRERAMTNRLGLSQQGLQTVGQFTSLAGQQEQMQNTFNLQNYENQVASAMMNQKSGTPWGSIGSVVGGVGGFMIGGPAGAMMGASLGGAVGGMAQGGSQGQSYAANSINSGMSGLGTGFGAGIFNPYTGTTQPTSTAAGMSAGSSPLTMAGGLNSNTATAGTRWLQ